MFDPVVGRSTSVVLAKSAASGQWCLVTSVSTRPSTEVIRIDPDTGLLAKNKDKYTDEASALGMLRERGYEVAQRGCALLGYVAAGGTAGVCLATRVRKKATLPGGHAVYLVTDSQWVLIPLQNGVASDPAVAALDTAFWTSLQQYTLNNAHYFCETVDLSRPFPSAAAVQDPLPDFVWNEWLREPLVSLGLADICPVLLQGAAECNQECHPNGERYSVALLSRRSRRHPGTRYLARGLNARAGPGNEIECELIMWTHPDTAEEPLQWARVVWRRGTVPIWWGVNLQPLQKGLQAEVYIREKEPYRGTVTYFRSLQQQHLGDRRLEAALAGADLAPLDAGPAPAAGAITGTGAAQQGQPAGPQQRQGDASLGVAVTCVNLLHANPKKLSELMLSEHFHEAVRFVRKRLGPEVPIKVMNFDWHGNMGRLSEEKAIEGFWSFMDPVLRQCGLASGTMEPAAEGGQWAGEQQSAGGSGAGSAGEGPFTPWPPRWRMRWHRQQRGIVRFNCADSLDRTNAATCFAMLPALQEGLRLLGVSLDCGGPGLQSPGAAALQRGARLPSHGGSNSGSAQDLQALNVKRADSEVLKEATQGGYLGHMFQQELPPGWDIVNHQGRPLYVDHINKRTQWHPPTMPAAKTSRPGFMSSAADMLARLQRQSSPPRIGERSGGGGASASRGSSRSSSFASLCEKQGGGPSESPQPGGSLGWAAGGSPASPGPVGLERPVARESSSHLIAHAGGYQSSPELRHAGVQAGGSSVGGSSRPSDASEAPSDMHPAADAPWGFFGLGSVAEVRERLYKEAVADYVEMFKVHGDIHSFLYTGSPAMHSHVLGLVVQGGKTYGASSGVGKLQNLRVAVQRRWNNTVSDASRQQAMELFLGLNLGKYFRGLDVLYPPPGGASGEAEALDPADLLPPDEEVHKSTELQHLPITVHHGVLGVQQDLADLEPLDEEEQAAAAAGQLDPLGAAGARMEEEDAEAAGPLGRGPLGRGVPVEGLGQELGPLGQPGPGPAGRQPQGAPSALWGGNLLSFGEAEGAPAEPAAPAEQAQLGADEAAAKARRQLQDLLL